MTDTLIVQLIPPVGTGDDDEHDTVDCAAQWLYLSGGETPGTSIPETGTLSGLLEQPPDDCRWVVLMPGEDVLTTTVRLPARRRRQALKALPFMLEDSIASDVTREHLAVGPDNAEGETPIAITRKQQLRDVLRAFTDAGITPEGMLADYAALPESPGAWHILVSGDRSIVRCPNGTGFSTPSSRLALMLNTADDPESGSPDRVAKIVRSPDTAAPELPGEWQIEEQLVASPLQHLATGMSDASLNLLQGEFRVMQRENWNWRPWAAAAVLALAAVSIALLEVGLETVRLDRESAQLRASMVELAREALPDTERIQDPQTQLLIAWRQLRNVGAGGAEFLPLLNQISATVGQTPVAVNGIRFRDGTLTLALQGSSLQQLDDLRQQIERQGLDASLLDASTDADSARSNLVIQAAEPRRPGSSG